MSQSSTDLPPDFEHPAGDMLREPPLVRTLFGVDIDPTVAATILANAAIKKEDGNGRTPEEAAARLEELISQFTEQFVDLTAASAAFATEKVDQYKNSFIAENTEQRRAAFAAFKEEQQIEANQMVAASGIMETITGLLSEIPNPEGKQELINSLIILAQQQVFVTMNERVRELDPDLYDSHEMTVPPIIANFTSIFNNIFKASLNIANTLQLEIMLLVFSGVAYFVGGSGPVVGLIFAYLARTSNQKMQAEGIVFKTTATEDLVAIFNGLSGVANDYVLPFINFVLKSSAFISAEVIKSVARDIKNFVLMPVAKVGAMVVEITKTFYGEAIKNLFRRGSSVSSASSDVSIGSGTSIPFDQEAFLREFFGSDASSVSSSSSTASNVALSISSVASRFAVPGNSAAMLLLTNVASSSQDLTPIAIPRVEFFSESQRDDSTPLGAVSLSTKEGVEMLKRKRQGGPSGGRKSRRYKKKRSTLKRRGMKRRRTRKGKKRRHTKKR